MERVDFGKRLAEQIFLEAMARVDVRRTMLQRIRKLGDQLIFPSGEGSEDSVSIARPPRVIAFGKAAGTMALALSGILEGQIESGVLVAPSIPEEGPPRFRCFAGGHPYPNEGSLGGAAAALEMLSQRAPQDLVIFLISGGGSALFEKPLDEAVTLRDLIEFNKVLVTSELAIEQINVLRKHISAVKGGRLALAAAPAGQLTIFISDVPEGLDSMVASGPTMPDSSSVADCNALAADHHLLERFPASIRRHFDQRSLRETPKPGDAAFNRSHYWRLLSNRDAVEAARAAAEKAGLVASVDRGRWDADFREVARHNCAVLDYLTAQNPGRAVCLVVGGEVTCPVTGSGVGGRNQAFVLEAAPLIAGRNRAVLSAGTDGRDGNSPAAGAVADGQTISRAQARNLDPTRYLTESDSYNFFRALGDTIEVGCTGNNVRDLRLWIDLGPAPNGGLRTAEESVALARRKARL
jgi:glycerate 2-kinase